MSGPRVTVIIPCFNDGELAEEAVASIREAEPVDIVVINDGSSEQGTIAALDRIAATGRARVVHQGNAGLTAARMAGVRRARTRFVFALDADDLLAEGALRRLADALDAEPSASFAFGSYETFGDHEGRWTCPGFSPWLAMHANWWSSSALYRVGDLLEVGGWSLAGGYEDWDLWLAFAEAGSQGVRVPVVAWRRRLHGVRMQGSCRASHWSRYRLLRERHHALYSRRAEHARAEGIPRLRRIAYPLFLGGRPLMPAWLEARLLPLWWRIGRLRANGDVGR